MALTIGDTWNRYKQASESFMGLPSSLKLNLAKRYKMKPQALSDDLNQVRRALFRLFFSYYGFNALIEIEQLKKIYP